MIALLAKSANQSPIDNLFENVTGMFSRGDALAHPDLIVSHLQSLSVVWATVFIIVGVLCLLNGYKFYKIAVVGLALLLGLFAGYGLGTKIGAPLIIAGCFGVLLAVLAFPLMKYAVALFGGLAGAFIGANLWAGFAHAFNRAAQTTMPADAYWVGALIGLMLFGMLAFVLFKLSIVLFTSVSGSTIAVLGVIALLLSFEPWTATVTSGLTANKVVIPLLVFIPAIFGLIYQEQWGRGGDAEADTA